MLAYFLHQVQLHRDVKIRVRKVDDNRVILLFDVACFWNYAVVDFTLYPAASERTTPAA